MNKISDRIIKKIIQTLKKINEDRDKKILIFHKK